MSSSDLLPVLFALLVFWVPVVILWVYCLVKIVRTKRSLTWKVAWAIAIIILPFIGALFFLLFGARSAAYEVTTGLGGEETRGELSNAEVLQELEQLRAAGRISPEDYEELKARHGGSAPASSPPPGSSPPPA